MKYLELFALLYCWGWIASCVALSFIGRIVDGYDGPPPIHSLIAMFFVWWAWLPVNTWRAMRGKL